ncbi:MAG TPA: DUF3617 family protein [Thiobacillus sp.]|nr:DUF3617 family protein [Thiobacillus sp.]
MRILLPAVLLSLSALPAAAASPVMQPGLYDISLQMVMKGMPMQMPVMTFRHCITAQDVVDGNAYASSQNSKDCKISNLKQSGNAVSYDFSCTVDGGRSMVGHSTGTHHATGYDITMNGRFEPAMEGLTEFNQKMGAKRLGPCK